MKIGYARVSTPDQHLDIQLDALNKYDCEKIYSEIISSAKAERIGLNQAFSILTQWSIPYPILDLLEV